MKKITYLLALILLTAGPAVWAMPSAITYQGTLKYKGLPAAEPHNMQFVLTDQSGNTAYSVVITSQITPVNGLFSIQLDFQFLGANNWESVTPYLKVIIDSNELSKPEPINATAYAILSNTVVDNAITQAKLSTDVAGALIPSGMIAMFANNCPSGWDVYTALQGKFPVGLDPNNLSQFSVGQNGGSLSHAHSISSDGSHKHRLPIFSNSGESIIGVSYPGNDPYGFEGATSLGGIFVHSPNSPLSTINAPSNIALSDSAGDHNHGGQTGSASSLPPYSTVVFCKKQ